MRVPISLAACVKIGLIGLAVAGGGGGGWALRAASGRESNPARVGVARSGDAMEAPTAGATPEMMAGTSGMACCGMMGGGMMRGALQETPPEQAKALGAATPAGAIVDAAQNEIRFNATAVSLTVLASPDDGPDMTFRIAGLANPRVVVPQGATVTIQFINADADTPHGWLLSAAQPPFDAMAMMDAPEAFAGAFGMPLPKATAAGMPTEAIRFTAGAAGQYTYLCPVMGHAQQGMDGAFVVAG